MPSEQDKLALQAHSKELQAEPYKVITSSNGMEIKVDAADYDYLSQFNWYAMKDRNTFYARSSARIDGKRRTMHQLLTGHRPGLVIDHINHDGLDNRRKNLRHVTNSVNAQNSIKIMKAYSRHRGVTWNKKLEKWQVHITKDCKLHYLGLYKDEEHAAQAYQSAARSLYANAA